MKKSDSNVSNSSPEEAKPLLEEVMSNWNCLIKRSVVQLTGTDGSISSSEEAIFLSEEAFLHWKNQINTTSLEEATASLEEVKYYPPEEANLYRKK
jgi:hypothetical protein